MKKENEGLLADKAKKNDSATDAAIGERQIDTYSTVMPEDTSTEDQKLPPERQNDNVRPSAPGTPEKGIENEPTIVNTQESDFAEVDTTIVKD